MKFIGFCDVVKIFIRFVDIKKEEFRLRYFCAAITVYCNMAKGEIFAGADEKKLAQSAAVLMF